MPKIQEYDRVIRCPLDENIHWFGIQWLFRLWHGAEKTWNYMTT
jgi:hypothetical protein